MKNNKKAVIIGAGFGGLPLAPLLAKEGFSVTVIEKNKELGGRARVFSKNGFVFDMGPSWYLMPDVFERYFSIFGKKPEDFFKLKRLDPSYRIFFDKQKIVDISSNLQTNLKIFDELEKNGANKLEIYLKSSKYQYDIAMKDFIYKDYSSFWDLLDIRFMTEGIKLNIFGSFDTLVSKYFSSDEAKKILEYTIVFLGGNPKNTPAMYSIMSHVDFNLGVWYPMGGIGEVVKALVRLGKEMGVVYKTDEEVKEIKVNSGIAQGIKTNKASYFSDIVIANADYHHVDAELTSPKWASYSEKYWQKRVLAPSAFIIYLGLSKKIKKLSHHNLFFVSDWMKHFETIFNNPSWPDEFSYYICCPSKSDINVAPKGKENLFVLVPISSGLKDTNNIREKYFDKTINHMEELTGESIRSNIEFSRIFTINDFKNEYNSFKGTALGLSHTLFQTALFRPQRKSKKVKNLYFTGSYTHPGIGVPMTLISSELTYNLIHKDNA